MGDGGMGGKSIRDCRREHNAEKEPKKAKTSDARGRDGGRKGGEMKRSEGGGWQGGMIGCDMPLQL